MTDSPNQSVCFVSLSAYGYFNPGRIVTGGGAERQLYLLGQQLREDFDVQFVVGDYGQPRTERRNGVKLHRSYRQDPDASVPARIGQVWKLFDAMRRADAELYVYRGFPHKAAVVGHLAELLGSSFVYHVSSDANVDGNVDGLPTPVVAMFGRALRRAGAVVAQSEYQRRRLQERFDIDAVVVPNGYPTASNVEPHDDRRHVLWVGNVDESKKRPHRYLDLAEQLPGERFLLAGPDGGDEAYCDRIRSRADGIDNATHLGEIHPDDIDRYFRDAKLLVNTSPLEGFPNTFLEAWRYETPVVGLDVDPGRFVDVPDSDCFADGDFERLVELVGRLAADPERRASLGESLRRQFEAEYSMHSTAAQYRDVLSRAIR
jgi:glycosyltransferase involved in cell wall biosynthesis